LNYCGCFHRGGDVQRVEKTLEAKASPDNYREKGANTLEKEIYLMVYHLYNLTIDEVHITDPAVSEAEYNRIKIFFILKPGKSWFRQ